MNRLLETIDSLFISSGLECVSNESNRYYYKKYFELERFEIEYSNSDYIKTIIPFKNCSYIVHIYKDNLYNYLYDHLELFLAR